MKSHDVLQVQKKHQHIGIDPMASTVPIDCMFPLVSVKSLWDPLESP